jgi:hypothetical protein
MDAHHSADAEASGGFRWVELAVVVAVCGLLLAIAAPSFFSRKGQAGSPTTIASDLALIEGAKNQMAQAKKLRNGVTVTMADLVAGGYLPKPVAGRNGVSYVVNPIGKPADYIPSSSH